MTTRDSPPPEPALRLYRRIGYDPDLEARALRRLVELDVAGCRGALTGLVRGLDLSRVDGDGRSVVQLLADVLQRVNQRLHRGPGAEPAYQARRIALIEEFGACEHPEEARGRFLEALNRLLAAIEPPAGEPHPLVERARRFIDESYWRRISLSTVAQVLHISPNYLSRLFRRETGSTLTAYIQRVRLERAMMLLASDAHSISEIAYRVGYQNYRDFYRNFVKYEKTAPGEFRRRHTSRRDTA